MKHCAHQLFLMQAMWSPLGPHCVSKGRQENYKKLGGIVTSEWAIETSLPE
jgi:hypothetical protein